MKCQLPHWKSRKSGGVFPEAVDHVITKEFFFQVLVSLKMFGGRPIECWLPAEYKKSWEDYAEMYCWARNTYFAPFDDVNLPNVEDRGKTMVSYYQWVPFFLVIVAFMFYSPCLLWRLLYDKSGIRLKDIMSFANDKSNVQPASRRANINGLAMHLASVFNHRFRFGSVHPYHHKMLKFLNLRFYEAYLTYLYLGIKLLFLINVLVQMFLLSQFLETNSQGFYGYGILWDLVTGQGWTESPNFPVVTYCDMEIRILGQVQRHTVQCVLVINIFTEKIFLLLWLWYTLLAVISFGSIMSWMLSSIPFDQRRNRLSSSLQFVRDFIKMDGVFVLRMMTIHSGVLICTEVVDTMWDQFLAEQGGSWNYDILAAKDDYKDDRSASAGAHSLDPPLGRKTSVLVPLMSREDLTQIPDHLMRSFSRT
ncbi:unnamed protein product [Angiostrongylus costaricensis]|uniref:Innexin n=1 Tax=Angiostrongylus costaricensis TaxID=334426 RepID=A0A3P7H9L7_ANGCS|nr:unnamed protein product [Angiostrongylus costaricensis]